MKRSHRKELKQNLHAKNETESISQKSSVIKFAENKWVVMVGLIIGLFGGCPGIYSIYKDTFDNKAKIVFNFEFGSSAGVSQVGNPNFPYKSAVIVCGAVINDGAKPWYPRAYQLTIKHKNQLSMGATTNLKPLVKQPKLQSKIKIDSNFTDLSTLPLFKKDEPVYGGIAFLFQIDEQEAWDVNNDYELICYDIYGNVKRFKFKLDPETMNVPGTYPHLNISIP